MSSTFICLQGKYSENVFTKRFCLCKMWLFPGGSRKGLTSSAENCALGLLLTLRGYFSLLGMLL